MKWLFVIVFITIALIPTFFISKTQQNEILVEGNFYNILEQLNYPSNWKKWQPSLKKAAAKDSAHCRIINDTANKAFSIEAPEHYFYVKKITPLSFEVQEKMHNISTAYAITVVSTILPMRTNIVTTQKISLLNYIFGRNKKNAAEISAYNLKNFLENPAAYYGYVLKTESVVDTNVVVTEKKVAIEDWRRQLNNMYNSLTVFIHKNHLAVKQPKIASFKMVARDSVEIRAGIPVDKTVRSDGTIQCLKMPKGRMLVGEYEGRYSKRASLSNAMEKYIRDHMMVGVAVPYEKYLNDSIPATDTSIVKLKMYYPVF